jgi:hypothetical protein
VENNEINNNAQINEMFGVPDPEGGETPPEQVAAGDGTVNRADDGAGDGAGDGTVNHADDVLLDGEKQAADTPAPPEKAAQTGEAAQPGEGDEQPITEGSDESFGFAKERDIKKAKAKADPRRIRTKIVVAVLPLFLVAGFVLGAFVCFVYYFGIQTEGEHKAAFSAAKAVKEHLTEKIGEDRAVTFINIFIKNKTEEYECVIFCTVGDGAVSYTEETFRVLINKNDGNTDVQDRFDPDEYERLSSGTDEERVSAALMMNHKREFERCVGEIGAEGTVWVGVDAYYINIRIQRAGSWI